MTAISPAAILSAVPPIFLSFNRRNTKSDTWRQRFAFNSVIWVVPLIIAAVLAATMAWISAFNAHPDEIHHARAADYYRSHWLPPKFGDPEAVASYSDYGYSYLHQPGVVYLLAGKWSTMVAPVVGNPDLAYRFFNVALLVAIALAFVRVPDARPLLVPLISSAQIWYVFSYFNGDAFVLAAALFTAYQATAPGSAFNAALEGDTRGRWFGGVLALGVGIGLLLTSKQNYYVFLLYLAAYAARREAGLRASLGVAFGALIGVAWYFRVFPGAPSWLYGCCWLAAGALIAFDIWRRLSQTGYRRRLGTYAAACAVGLALFVPRAAFDKLFVENSANYLSSAEATAEVFAADGYKPSQIAHGVAKPFLYLRAGGTPYVDMMFGEKHHWVWTSFQSMVGVYGYMRLFSSDRFYTAVAIVYLAFLASLGYWAWRSGDASARDSMLIAGVFAVLAVLVSSLHSWESDLQRQGRYLFPAFVMFGVALMDLRGRKPALAPVAAVLAFVLAFYSFLDAGLGLIPRS